MYQYTNVGAISAASAVSSPLRVAAPPSDWTWLNDTARSTSMVLDSPSPFGSPFKRTTAQAAGVLIVDDDPQIRAILTAILTLEGYVVWRASNGLEALAVLDHARPALVMLDMRMPDLNGWGFARALEGRGLQLPMLVITAAEEGQRWAEEIGAAACVTKPFDVADLLAQVERLVPPG